eukprot:7996670-Karenia_brevis.AAC.1
MTLYDQHPNLKQAFGCLEPFCRRHSAIFSYEKRGETKGRPAVLSLACMCPHPELAPTEHEAPCLVSRTAFVSCAAPCA